MPLVSSTIPNLVGGISQQPDALRLPTTCRYMENTSASIINGLLKRPPTRHIANLGSALPDGAFGYLIERDESYKYLAIFGASSVRVLDITTGTFQTVHFPDGTGYLTSTSPVDSFRCITFGDFTFISNRNIVVDTLSVAEPAVDGQTRLDPTGMGTAYVTLAAYNTYYTVYVNGVKKAEYLTPSGVSGSPACPDTSLIAKELRDDLVAAGYTTLLVGSTVTITNLPSGAVLSSQGGTGDKSVRVFVQDIQQFSDLPPSCPEGRIVRVAGDLQANSDDYFVVYNNGVWRETIGWNAGEIPNASTMPHVLVRESDGSWTFRKHEWAARSSGDTVSSRNPSFVGFKINDIFVYTNRLGVLSDENIILSESNVFENFYRTTTAQLLDSDPIDLAVLHNNVDIMYHAVPYNRDLLLMSERNQFRFSYDQFLGQKTASIRYTTSFNVSTRVRPLNIGNSVYFVDDRTDYIFSKVYEFYPKDNSTQDDADDVTDPVPEFIPNNILFQDGSNRAKIIILNSASEPTALYVYKYFWVENRKIQNAWTKWTFPDCTKIYWAGFSGLFVYVLMERSGIVCLEKIRCDEDIFDNDTNYEILLDRRTVIDPIHISYNSSTDKTIIDLPYTVSTPPEVISSKLSEGVSSILNKVTLVSPTQISIMGDYSTYSITAGIPYITVFDFPTLFARQFRSMNNDVVMLDGRLQLRYLTLEYHNTATFTYTVSYPGRDPVTSEFSGFAIGSGTSQLGRQSFSTGKLRIPLMAENYKVSLRLTNASPFPSAFGSAEWQGIISPKSVTRL